MGFSEVDFSSEFDFTDQMSPAMQQLSMEILTPDSDPIPEDQMDLTEQARQDQFFADAHAKCDAQMVSPESISQSQPTNACVAATSSPTPAVAPRGRRGNACRSRT